MTRAEEILKWVNGPNVLDIGCVGHEEHLQTRHGLGSVYWLHAHLRKRFPVVYGIDISEPALAQIRELGYDHLYLQSAEGFTFDTRFNTIVAGELIEHLANPGLFLERCKAHLATGGRVVLTTPSPFSLMNLLYGILKYPKTASNEEHTCWFCPQTLKSLAQRSGFEVAHMAHIEDYLPGVRSIRYRVFIGLMGTLGRLLPMRLRGNTVLYVLEQRVEDQSAIGD